MSTPAREAGSCPRPNFSGFWRQVKNDNFEGWLTELEIPWVIRKAMVKYGSQSADVIRHVGGSLRVTTVNAKASWTRESADGRTITQRNARGEPVKVEARWEGAVHKTIMTGGRLGPHQCWRYMEGGLMAICSSVLCSRGECVMHWYLELITEPERLLCNPDGSAKLKTVSTTQKRIQKATGRDTALLRGLLLQTDKWDSPADHLPGTFDKGNKDGPATLSMSAPSSRTMSPMSVSPRTSQPSHAHAAFADATLASTSHVSSGADEQPTLPAGSRGDTSGARSPLGLSTAGSEALVPAFAVDGSKVHSTSGMHRRMPSDGAERSGALHPRTLEAALSMRLQEYAENRSITNVIPLDTDHSCADFLLDMSPEQAEATELKVAELEREMRRLQISRAKYASGYKCCCCTVLFHNAVIPNYVRVWDM